MNDILKEDNGKMSTKLKIFYGIIITICILALIGALGLQIKANNDKKQKEMPQVSQTDYMKNLEKFNRLFDNEVNYMSDNNYKVTKLDESKEIIYIGYQKIDKKLNDYDLNINIPYINIKDDTIEEFNNEIQSTFEKKAKSVLNIKNNDIIYEVDYSAYITNNILSLVIKSTLKEGNSPQREIVQTYNYNLTSHKECTIQDLLELRNITKQQANQQIREVIKEVEQKVEAYNKMGYNIYSRNIDDDKYTINNVTEYFIGEDNKIYVIFAYGNESNTTETDVVII